MVRGTSARKKNIHRLAIKYLEVGQLLKRDKQGMSSANKGNQSAERKLRRSLDYIRNRGVEELGVTTRAQSAKHSTELEAEKQDSPPMESDRSLQGAVGGTSQRTGTVRKQRYSELPNQANAGARSEGSAIRTPE